MKQIICETIMFKVKLPLQINPLRLGQQLESLCGYVPVDGMSRLAELVHTPDVKEVAEHRCEVKLSFSINEFNRPVAKGTMQLTVNLICQRCLKPFAFNIISDINWAFAKDDAEAKQIQGSYDPILVEDGKVDLFTQIEDEIILNLPMIALHDDMVLCGSVLKVKVEANDPVKENPFAGLANLKVVKKLSDD